MSVQTYTVGGTAYKVDTSRPLDGGAFGSNLSGFFAAVTNGLNNPGVGSIVGTANKVTATTVSGVTTLTLPSTITVNVTGNVTGNLTGNISGNAAGGIFGSV